MVIKGNDGEGRDDSLGQLLMVLTNPVAYAEKSAKLLEAQAQIDVAKKELHYLQALKREIKDKEEELEVREDAAASKMAEAIAMGEEFEAKLAKYNRFMSEI